MSTPNDITIPRKMFDRLVYREELLSRLEQAGVDNWEGYHLAFRDDEDEDQ